MCASTRGFESHHLRQNLATAYPSLYTKHMNQTKLTNKTASETVSFTWTSPSRPYKQRNREYYTTIASITFLLGIILLLLKEFLLIGVIIATAFLAYVLASVPPQNITHKITSKGLETDGRFFTWDQLNYFWLTQKWNFDILNIITNQPLPNHLLIIILDPQQKSAIVDFLKTKLPLKTPEPGFVDKASRWLQEKIPLES